MQKLIDVLLLRALPVAAAACVACPAFAVKPASFTHTTEADFADGDAQSTVVTNLGDIKLSSDTEALEGLPEDATVIQDIATHRGVQYVAVGPDAKLLMIKDGKASTVAELPGEQVFAIEEAQQGIYVGVSGDAARVIFLPGKKMQEATEPLNLEELPVVWNLPEGTKYIWDIKRTRQGHMAAIPPALYAATGPEGKVFRLSKKNDGGLKMNVTEVLSVTQPNVLSLGLDERKKVLVDGDPTDSAVQFYAGTDVEGLIYRVDPQGQPFVVYDAPEAEVSSLVVMKDGTVYAGTSAADQAKPGRLAQPVKVEEGRPAPPEEPAPAEEPEQPEPEVEEPDEPAEEPEQPEEPAKPETTPEQYDALREELRQRLEEARESGSLTGDGDAGAEQPNKQDKPKPSRAKPAAPAVRKKGNAVYQVSPDGFVSEVFRESAMILAIVLEDGKLIIATGNEGQVYAVDPILKETTVLADLDSAQITSAVPTDKGLLLGAANPGALMLMATEVAGEGSYTSRVLDAGQISLYGKFKITAEIPEGTAIKVEMRSGNVGDPELAAWSKWSEAETIPYSADANPLQPRELDVSVPPARYLQYRLSLTTEQDDATPVIDQVDVAYVAPNTPPIIAKLIAKPAPVKAPGNDPDPKVTIQWQATDANRDRLVYSVEYKPGKAKRYLPLAEDLTAPKYEWMTQHVPDGWYTLRVTAHDKLDNPASSAKTGGRISEPLLIDNTAPTLQGLKAVVKDGKVTLSAKVTDELSPITSVAYSIDGSDDYQASLPDDLIYDSTKEPWGVTISDLSPGGHVIAVRAIDAKGNTAYRQLIVEVQ